MRPHIAFDPAPINPSREFFEIEPELVEALLRVMPGKDVTPRISEQESGLQPEELEAASEYKNDRPGPVSWSSWRHCTQTGCASMRESRP